MISRYVMSAHDHKHLLWMNHIAMPERTSVGGSVSWRPDPLAQGKELGHSSNWSKLGGTPGEGMLTEAAAVASAGSSSAWFAAVCAGPPSRPRGPRHAVWLPPRLGH